MAKASMKAVKRLYWLKGLPMEVVKALLRAKGRLWWYTQSLPVRAPQGKFVLITGVGHCGTRWLATVLNRPDDGIVCYHEHKNVLLPHGLWHKGIRHDLDHGVDSYYGGYFESILNQLSKYEVVGDSHSWTVIEVPEVDKRFHIDMVIHLVRNGIQNVHSLFLHNETEPVDTRLVFEEHFRRWGELVGGGPGEWESYTRWEAWCFYWSLNSIMPAWMAERLGENRVLVFRLEDLTSQLDILLDLMRRIHPAAEPAIEELETLQGQDVNRKIEGDRSPKALWNRWNDEQREVFRRICGPTMEEYGYAIPSLS